MKDIHLFFDLDRTLWDFEKNSKAALKTIYKDFKLSEKTEDFSSFHKYYKQINAELWNEYGAGRLTKDLLRWKRFDLALHKYGVEDEYLSKELAEAYVKRSPFQTNLFPGTIETLRDLQREGYPMHIITNGFEEVQHIKLRESGLEEFFDVVLCSEQTGTSKPDKLVFDTALKMAKTTAEKSVYIGDDYEVDYCGALNANMKAVFFNFRGEKKVRKDDEVIEHLRELPAKIPWLFRFG